MRAQYEEDALLSGNKTMHEFSAHWWAAGGASCIISSRYLLFVLPVVVVATIKRVVH